jgi:hypothetical protein
MYSLAKELGLRGVLVKEAPFLLLSLIIAEMFYKWHSFTKEMLGFLVTWYVLSFVGNTLVAKIFPAAAQTQQPG